MDEMVEHMRSKEASKKVTFSLPDDSETEDVTEAQLEKDTSPSEIKSSFEKRQEKVVLVWFSLGFVHILFGQYFETVANNIYFTGCFICSESNRYKEGI